MALIKEIIQEELEMAQINKEMTMGEILMVDMNIANILPLHSLNISQISSSIKPP